jgi:hypothetical protein
LALRRRICHGIVNQCHRVVLQAFRHVTVKVERDADAAVAKRSKAASVSKKPGRLDLAISGDAIR